MIIPRLDYIRHTIHPPSPCPSPLFFSPLLLLSPRSSLTFPIYERCRDLPPRSWTQTPFSPPLHPAPALLSTPDHPHPYPVPLRAGPRRARRSSPFPMSVGYWATCRKNSRGSVMRSWKGPIRGFWRRRGLIARMGELRFIFIYLFFFQIPPKHPLDAVMLTPRPSAESSSTGPVVTSLPTARPA